MDQNRLCDALNKMAVLVDAAKKSDKSEAADGVIKVKLGQQWMGIDPCKWPGCQEEADQSSWVASRNGVSVQIWGMMFHYAKVNHWISFTDISEEDQAKLVDIFK